jgi:predicted dehydrogenase
MLEALLHYLREIDKDVKITVVESEATAARPRSFMDWFIATEGMQFTINIYGTGEQILLDVRNESFTEFHGVRSPIEESRIALAKAFNASKGALTGSYFTRLFLFYRQLILDFVESIQNSRPPSVTVEEALMTTTILEAAKTTIEQDKPIAITDLFAQSTEFTEIS